jgi:hypothetical protein
MPYGVLPNQQMSRYEQGGYVPPFAPQYKRKIAVRRKNFADPWAVKEYTRRDRLRVAASI